MKGKGQGSVNAELHKHRKSFNDSIELNKVGG